MCEKSDVFASGCAIARALPLFNSKSSNSNSKRSVTVEFLLVGSDNDLSLSDSDIECLSVVASAIRLTARIVDAPCADMHTDAFLDVSIHVHKMTYVHTIAFYLFTSLSF